VIAATGAQQPILTVPMVRKALKDRRYRTIFLIDLAVPRNIEAGVDDLEDAYLFNVDDLSKVVEQGRAAREQAARQALAVVEEEADRFLASLRESDVAGELRALGEAAEQIRLAELDRSKKLVASLDEAQLAQLDAMTKALVKKLLHKPTSAIRTAAKAGDADLVQALVDLWKES